MHRVRSNLQEKMVVDRKIRKQQISSRFRHLVVNTYLTDDNQIVLDRHIALHAVHTADHPTQAMAVIAQLSNPGVVYILSGLICNVSVTRADHFRLRNIFNILFHKFMEISI